MSAQQHTSRTYRTLIDTLSDIGGFSDILLMMVGIFYGFYLDSQLEKDLIHKALTLTGKFGISDEHIGDLDLVWGEKNFKNPRKVKKPCRVCFWRKRVGPILDDGAIADNEILDDVFDNILKRQ
jgi:hypothetical protein